MLRGDNVKDGTGCQAVFIEQGASASQMTAVKILHTISLLLGMVGKAHDARSAYTRVKMKNAPRLVKLPKTECPTIWVRFPGNRWLATWDKINDLVVLLESNMYSHPSGGLLWKRKLEELQLQDNWRTVQRCGCLYFHRKDKRFLSVFGDDIKMVGRRESLAPM